MSDDILESNEADPSAEPTTTEAPRASLTARRGGIETDQRFEFGSPATVGRFDPAMGPVDVDLAGTPEAMVVSRRHAKFTCEDSVWRVEDLGSSNKTFILRDDFQEIAGSEVVVDGDVIAFGNAHFVFRTLPPNDDAA